MERKFLWIADFQFESERGVKVYSTCVEGADVREALGSAWERAYKFQFAYNARHGGFRTMVTGIGLAGEAARERLGKVWPDPINDPDPELFKQAAGDAKGGSRYEQAVHGDPAEQGDKGRGQLHRLLPE